MISKGWLTSRSDDYDQRRIQYALTENGTKIVEEIWPLAKQFAGDTAELFDDDEFAQFRKMLDRANESCDTRLKACL